MAKRLVGSGTFETDDFGRVRFTVRPTARRFVARWRGGELCLSVPRGADLTDVARALAEMRPRLLAAKPKQSVYHVGQTLTFESCTINIKGIVGYGAKCSLHRIAASVFEIRVDDGEDFASPEAVVAVGRLIKSVARYLAPALLLPRAEVLAAQLGLKPRQFALSYGQKVLGRCDSRGVIRLSSLLALYPAELRDYVIWHELAHLTEMNHSPRFHALCDRYCGGREHDLERRFKAFRLPL